MLELLAQLQTTERNADTCPLNNEVCPGWIAENFDRYVSPIGTHLVLSLIPVVVGFAIAFGLAVLAHKRRWLTGPIVGFTGFLYTIPSIAAFLLLLPITGRGLLTALIALTAYTLLILFRNVTTGLRNVPRDAIDAARGMGLTDNQILYKVELPLARPEIIAGLRIAFTTTVGLAAFAVFAGAGGLGTQLLTESAGTGGQFFKGNVLICGILMVLIAALGDLVLLTLQRITTPWRRAVAA